MNQRDSLNFTKLGLIAGNGQLPFLVLEQALKQGLCVLVAAIREEATPEIEAFARQHSSSSDSQVCVRWLGLGQLAKLIRVFKEGGVDKVVMAGQVKHLQIFAPKGPSASKDNMTFPDWKMARVLWSLPRKNTSSLIGAVAKVLEEEGIELIDSTFLLRPLLPKQGVLTRRKPTREEWKDIKYGRVVAREVARLDLGQTIVVKDQAVVAVEAMEGTDETIWRAARLVKRQRLTVIKSSRPHQDMRFDVPVTGMQTLKVLGECHVSAMAISAEKTLILEREEFIQKANKLGITIVSLET